MDTEYYTALLSKIEDAIAAMKHYTCGYDSDCLTKNMMPDDTDIAETILNYGLEWEFGVDIPTSWEDFIWGRESFTEDDLYQVVSNSEEYKTLAAACERLVDTATDLAISENIEAAQEWNDWVRTAKSLGPEL